MASWWTNCLDRWTIKRVRRNGWRPVKKAIVQKETQPLVSMLCTSGISHCLEMEVACNKCLLPTNCDLKPWYFVYLSTLVSFEYGLPLHVYLALLTMVSLITPDLTKLQRHEERASEKQSKTHFVGIRCYLFVIAWLSMGQVIVNWLTGQLIC